MIVRCLLSAYRNVCMCLHDGRPEDVWTGTTRHQQVADENANNSSVSATRRFLSHVDRLFDGSTEDRERAFELLKANEQQVPRPLSHNLPI